MDSATKAEHTRAAARRSGDCPLCAAEHVDRRRDSGYDSPLAGILWSAWHTDGVAGVLAVCRQHEIDEVTPVRVVRHFGRHEVEQPPPPIQRRELIDQLADRLEPWHLRILMLAYRLRVLDEEQLRVVDAGTPGGAGSRRALAARIEAMCGAHLLYRVYHQGRPVYLLGRSGALVLERFGHELRVDQTPRRLRDVSPRLIPHDLKANWMALTLAERARRGEVPFGAESATVTAAMENWLGPRQLTLGFRKVGAGRPQAMQPDGFCALGVTALSSDRLPFDAPGGAYADSVLLPVLLEYDHGTRDLDDVTEQLATYRALGASGALGGRIPLLRGAQVPVVMVMSSPLRARRLLHRVYEAVRGSEEGSLLLLVDEERWYSALDWPVLSNPARPELPPQRLLDALWGALGEWALTSGLDATTLLQVDPHGGAQMPEGYRFWGRSSSYDEDGAEV